MAKETGRKLVASNRKARHDYLIEDTYEAGLVLMGTEVKALRMGRASLVDGWAGFDRDDELWLEGVHIPEYANGTWTNHTPRRKRKLLLHRDQISELMGLQSAKGMTLVPLKLYLRGGTAKLEVGVGRGKKAHDKRRTIAERDMRRELDRDSKEAGRIKL